MITLLNLLRDLLISAYFGASLLSDSYFLACAFPVLLVTVFSNSYKSSVIPSLEAVKNSQADRVFPFLAVLNGSLLRCILFFGLLYSLSVSVFISFSETDKDILPSVSVLYLYLIVGLVYCLSFYIEANVSHFQFLRKFLVGSFFRFGLPLGTILGCIFLSSFLSIFSLPVGAGIGVVLTLILLTYWHSRNNCMPKFLAFLEPSKASMLRKNMFALSVGTSLAYVNPVIDQLVSAQLDEGSVAILGYSSRLATGLGSLTAGVIGPILLVYYSSAVLKKDSSVESLFRYALTFCTWLACGLVFFVCLYSEDLVKIFYSYGAMGESDSNAVAHLVLIYGFQYLPLMLCSAIYPLISALNLNSLFIPINLTLLIANFFLDILLVNVFGLAGIAFSTVAVYFLSFFLMLWLLHKKTGISPSIKFPISFLVTILVFTLLYCFILFVDSYSLYVFHGVSLLSVFFVVCFLIFLGFFLYLKLKEMSAKFS